MASRRLGAAQVATLVGGTALALWTGRVGAYVVVVGIVIGLQAARRQAVQREWQRFREGTLLHTVAQRLRNVQDGPTAYTSGRSVGRELVAHRSLPAVPAPWARRTRAEGVAAWLSTQLPHAPPAFLEGLQGTVRRHADRTATEDG